MAGPMHAEVPPPPNMRGRGRGNIRGRGRGRGGFGGANHGGYMNAGELHYFYLVLCHLETILCCLMRLNLPLKCYILSLSLFYL